MEKYVRKISGNQKYVEGREKGERNEKQWQKNRDRPTNERENKKGLPAWRPVERVHYLKGC